MYQDVGIADQQTPFATLTPVCDLW